MHGFSKRQVQFRSGRGVRTGLAALCVAAGASGFTLALAQPAAAAVSCPGADKTYEEIGAAGVKAAVICLTNYERAALGLSTLVPNSQLETAAQWHADDMVARDYFEHEAPSPAPHGVKAGDRIEAAGYDWSTYGENIAVGFATPRDVMEAWLLSKGHCENIFDAGYDEIGIGFNPKSSDGDEGGMWGSNFASKDAEDFYVAAKCPRSPARPAPVDGPADGSGPVTPSTGAARAGFSNSTLRAKRRLRISISGVPNGRLVSAKWRTLGSSAARRAAARSASRTRLTVRNGAITAPSPSKRGKYRIAVRIDGKLIGAKGIRIW